MSLDTLANVKARMGVSTSADDALLALLQDSADQFIENWCERHFEGGTFTEIHPGGSPYLHLKNYPVATVTSVKVDVSYGFGSETIVPSSAYVVHTERGVIQSLGGSWLSTPRTGLLNQDVRDRTGGPRVVQVVYTVTTNEVPADVKEAYARLIATWYRRVKTESGNNFQNVAQQKLGDTFVIYTTVDGSLAAEIRVLLAPYRTPRL